MSSSKGVILIPPLSSDPTFLSCHLVPSRLLLLPAPDLRRQRCPDSGGEGPPGCGSPTSFPGVSGVSCWPLGALVRLRVLCCDDLSGEFVLGSLQAEKAEWESRLAQLTPRGQVDPRGFLFRYGMNLRASHSHGSVSQACFSCLDYRLSRVDKYLCG